MGLLFVSVWERISVQGVRIRVQRVRIRIRRVRISVQGVYISVRRVRIRVRGVCIRIRGGVFVSARCVLVSGGAYECSGCRISVQRMRISVHTQKESSKRTSGCLYMCVRVCTCVSVRAHTYVFVDVWCAYVCCAVDSGSIRKDSAQKMLWGIMPVGPREDHQTN